MNYLRKSQPKLRRALYKGLMDACERDTGPSDIGKAFILPSSFKGGPRQKTELFHDAMALVSKYGRPDLFLTFTCNPKWREINENMFTGQTSWDALLIVPRIFNLKAKAFLDDLLKRHVLGKVKAWVYTIEFQKRGLPHLHCLLILEDEFKLKTPEQIDKIIWAEIPDKNKYPALYEKVMRHMIHHPCSSPFAKCQPGNGDQCSKGFPKSYQEATSLDSESYPLYRRRRTPKHLMTYRRTKIEISNQYVVSYNPYFIQKYDNHINVEVVHTIKTVKYLYKYLFKNNDRAIVKLFGRDEISLYENCRYVSSVEAYWKTKDNFLMHGRHPCVVRLPVHLENEHEVIYCADQDVKKALDKTDTELTAWFKFNQDHPEFEDVTYFEIPKYATYTSKDNVGTWNLRKKNKLNKNNESSRTGFDSKFCIYEDIVSRPYSVSPKEPERFFLRAILKHQAGAKSFKHLRTIGDVTYATYREVASKLGLLEDDEIWKSTIQEAITIQTNSYKLRQLFAQILVQCCVHKPLELWNEFKAEFGDDFRRANPGLSDSFYHQQILAGIMDVLQQFNKTLSDYNLPAVEVEQLPQKSRGFDGRNEEQTIEKFEQLTSDQKNIYKEIESRLERRRNGALAKDANLVYIDAPGGTGKTYLLNTIIREMTKREFNVIAVAHTGVASVLLHNGRTAHSMFNLPLNIDDDEKPYCDIRKGSDKATTIREVDMIIIDEISTVSKHHLECLERTLCDLCPEEDGYFAGKLMVFAGDFRQILPIVPFGGREKITAQIVKNTSFWQYVHRLKLTKNLRIASNQGDFEKYLLDVGEGRVPTNEDEEIEIDRSLIHTSSLDEFINLFFGSSFSESNSEQYSRTSILAPLNADVHHLNNLILNKLKSNNPMRVYRSLDTICPEFDKWNVPTELLNRENPQGYPLHELELKTGATAFILRNIDPANGVCNGTRILITELHQHQVFGRIISDKFKGTEVRIHRIDFVSDEKSPEFRFRRRQFPLRLAFASTLNRIQGQTLEHVGIYLRNEMFSHGHFYTAITRTHQKKNIKIMFDNASRRSLRNIVYHEVLDREQLIGNPNLISKTSKPNQSKDQVQKPTKRRRRAERVPSVELSEQDVELQKEKVGEQIIEVSDNESSTSVELPKEKVTEQVTKVSNNESSTSDHQSPIVVSQFGITLRRDDIEVLTGTNWLNDNIIDFYFQMIEAENDSIKCFRSQFLSLFMRSGHDIFHSSDNLNLFNFDLILVPVYLPSHWALIAVYPREHHLVYLDSKLNSGIVYLEAMRSYLRNVTGEEQWTIATNQDIPRQFNNHDCGVFVCEFGIRLARKIEFNFAENQMSTIRERMKTAIKRGKLDQYQIISL